MSQTHGTIPDLFSVERAKPCWVSNPIKPNRTNILGGLGLSPDRDIPCGLRPIHDILGQNEQASPFGVLRCPLLDTTKCRMQLARCTVRVALFIFIYDIFVS